MVERYTFTKNTRFDWSRHRLQADGQELHLRDLVRLLRGLGLEFYPKPRLNQDRRGGLKSILHPGEDVRVTTEPGPARTSLGDFNAEGDSRHSPIFNGVTPFNRAAR